MYNFDVKTQTENCINWIRDWFKENSNEETKAIVGISGGKDSTTVAGLLVKALGKDRVIGVMMPNGEQKDISDSIKVCEFLGIKNYTVNISKALHNLTMDILTAMDKHPRNISDSVDITSQYSTNTPARIRMTTLYGIGAMIGNCRVANTCNLSESIVGWETFGGDGFGDFSPLGWLTKTEVVRIGKYLGLPEELIDKSPSDGMCGQTDEDKLGFTYNELDNMIRDNVESDNSDKILVMNKSSHFKHDIIHIPTFDPKMNINPEFNW